MKKPILILCLLSLLTLVGCGQTGALYFPDENQQQTQP